MSAFAFIPKRKAMNSPNLTAGNSESKKSGSNQMTRQELFDWCRQQYGTEPDYPWYDRNAVLRHKDNHKWYGVVLEVDQRKLGLADEGMADILNVKCEPVMIGSLRMKSGFYPAYHMNKDTWISIMLNRPEMDETIKGLLSLSYELTKGKSKKH